MNARTSPTRKAAREKAERFATHAARVLSDARCEDVIVLRVGGISSITDYLVIASGTSDKQLASVADDVEKLAKLDGQSTDDVRKGSGNWVVIDLFDVVVHVFEPDARAYYDLESLWSDGAKVDWQGTTEPGQFTKALAGAVSGAADAS